MIYVMLIFVLNLGSCKLEAGPSMVVPEDPILRLRRTIGFLWSNSCHISHGLYWLVLVSETQLANPR